MFSEELLLTTNPPPACPSVSRWMSWQNHLCPALPLLSLNCTVIL